MLKLRFFIITYEVVLPSGAMAAGEITFVGSNYPVRAVLVSRLESSDLAPFKSIVFRGVSELSQSDFETWTGECYGEDAG